MLDRVRDVLNEAKNVGLLPKIRKEKNPYSALMHIFISKIYVVNIWTTLLP